MTLLYSAVLYGYYLLIRTVALFNPKAKKWVSGRKNLFEELKEALPVGGKRAWFHFASLGEFEQGRPVLEAFRNDHPGYLVVISFFSPSGYEARKDFLFADHVTYLPLDTPAHAHEFISLLKPDIAFFTKYEYWYFHFRELKQRNIPLYMISAIFRESQPFFKWYGSLHREMLRMVSYFFVQDERSGKMLESLGLYNYVISGDTRFDRVLRIAGEQNLLEDIALFKANCPILIAGSTWPEDEQRLKRTIEDLPADWKCIIVPHEISKKTIDLLQKSLTVHSVCYSQFETTNNYRVLIIDQVGILAYLYRYADIAYIGGGFGKGIHNILEAATYGLPVVFGPAYEKFKEATDLVDLEGAISVETEPMLYDTIHSLIKDPQKRKAMGLINKQYTQKKAGATRLIIERIGELV